MQHHKKGHALAGKGGVAGRGQDAEEVDTALGGRALENGLIVRQLGKRNSVALDGGELADLEVADRKCGTVLGVCQQIVVIAPSGGREGLVECCWFSPTQPGEGGRGRFGRGEEKNSPSVANVIKELALQRGLGFWRCGMPEDEGCLVPPDFVRAFCGEAVAGILSRFVGGGREHGDEGFGDGVVVGEHDGAKGWGFVINEVEDVVGGIGISREFEPAPSAFGGDVEGNGEAAERGLAVGRRDLAGGRDAIDHDAQVDGVIGGGLAGRLGKFQVEKELRF